jgi:hypothetical protein
MLVQWTDVDSRLSGTFDSAVLSSNESRVVAKVCSVNGSESGPSLVVTISCPGVAGSVRFSGSVTRSGIVLYMPQPSGTIEAAAFAPGSVASYDTAVRRLQAQTEIPSLKAYVSSHNVRPDPVLFGQSITVRTAPFSTRGQILAIVGYNTSPKVVPVLATLRWGGSSWSQVWLATVFGGWTGLPYRLTPLALERRVVTYGLNGIQTAGDDSPGAVVSDIGGKWHLVPFVLPLGTSAFDAYPAEPDRETTTLITPTFGSGGTVTLSQIWDAGQCQELLRFRYSDGRGAFVPIGSVQHRFKVSTCKAY